MWLEDSRHFNNVACCCSPRFLSADHYESCEDIIKMKVKLFTPRKGCKPSFPDSVQLANPINYLSWVKETWGRNTDIKVHLGNDSASTIPLLIYILFASEN